MKKLLFILLTPLWLIAQTVCIITSLNNRISQRAYKLKKGIEGLW